MYYIIIIRLLIKFEASPLKSLSFIKGGVTSYAPWRDATKHPNYHPPRLLLQLFVNYHPPRLLLQIVHMH